MHAKAVMKEALKQIIVASIAKMDFTQSLLKMIRLDAVKTENYTIVILAILLAHNVLGLLTLKSQQQVVNLRNAIMNLITTPSIKMTHFA
jgi:hypothetical protein